MGVFLASILFLSFSCSKNSPVPNGYFLSEQGYLNIQVQRGWLQSEICVELVSNLMMTEQCTPAEIRDVEEQIWLDISVETGVGQADLSIQITDDMAFVPVDSLGTLWQFEIQSTPISRDERSIWDRNAKEHIQANKTAWVNGSFALVNTQNQIKGALVFSDEEVRIFVFDRFWYTPEVQYTQIIEENGDWLLYFESEPSFFDDLSILRVHPLQGIVTVPRNNEPSKQDIRYQLRPDPPSFDVLKQLADLQIEESKQSEVYWLQEEANRLLEGLRTEGACISWKPSVLDINRLVGYEYQMEWDAECTFVVEPTLEQHTRRYSGRLIYSN